MVALFFAIEESGDQDADVWALSPTRLNLVETGSESIYMPDSSMLGSLSMQAFRADTTPKDERILGVLTEETDVRHMVQQSVFTLHGRGEPLEQGGASGQFLVRIRVPGSAKRGLRQVLALYGINRANLFPDLENLAAELVGLDFVEGSEE